MAYGYGYQPVYPAAPGYPSYQARRSAPASVHIVAILHYLGGAVLLLGAGLVALVTFGATPQYADAAGEIDAAVGLLGGSGLAIAGLFAFLGLLTVVLGRRLQRGRQWARVLVLLLSAASLAWTLYANFVAYADNRPSVLSGVVFPVLYLIMLNTPAARSWFRHRTY